jgi:hypothetical protein
MDGKQPGYLEPAASAMVSLSDDRMGTANGSGDSRSAMLTGNGLPSSAGVNNVPAEAFDGMTLMASRDNCR